MGCQFRDLCLRFDTALEFVGVSLGKKITGRLLREKFCLGFYCDVFAGNGNGKASSLYVSI